MPRFYFDSFDAYLPEWFRSWRDKGIVSRDYSKRYKREMNWANPTRYSEKIQVIKTDPQYESLSTYIDKYAVRDYVQKTIGANHLVKLYGCFNNTNEVNINTLPDSFVMKPTHGSGWIVRCPDKKMFNWGVEKKKLDGWLATNFYFRYRERPYRHIVPRIVVEEYLGTGDTSPNDIKIFCFGGKPTYVEIDTDRFAEKPKNRMYDLKWNYLFGKNIVVGEEYVSKPDNLAELLQIAEKLAKPFAHVRVDLFSVGGHIYFSELTFMHASGFSSFITDEWDTKLGELFTLTP